MARIITKTNVGYFAAKHAANIEIAMRKLKETFERQIQRSNLSIEVVKLSIETKLEIFPAKKGHYAFSVLTGIVMPAMVVLTDDQMRVYTEHLRNAAEELSHVKPLTDYITIRVKHYQHPRNRNSA